MWEAGKEMKVTQGQYDSERKKGGEYKEQLQSLNVTIRRAENERGRCGYFTKWINAFLGCLKLQILIYFGVGFYCEIISGVGG